MTARGPTLSVVVVAYDMERELPRTLLSLSTPYQTDLAVGDYEIVVIDNGSPVSVTVPKSLPAGLTVRVHRIDPAPRSPAHGANVGLGMAHGELVGLIIDGARMASPGLLAGARAAAKLGRRTVVTAPAWHLGPLHSGGPPGGHDQRAEDDLLASVHWPRDGYALFGVSAPAASSGRGLFGPMGESSSLFMGAEMWAELGGLDERFESPGGGLVNHDLYIRACDLPDAELVVVLGEGTFHQTHGGASTSGKVSRASMHAEYEAIRGRPQRPPSARPTYVGRVPAAYLGYVRDSAERAAARVRADG